MTGQRDEIFKQKVNDCVQHIILQKFTNFHANRSWNFQNIGHEIGWPRFFAPPCIYIQNKYGFLFRHHSQMGNRAWQTQVMHLQISIFCSLMLTHEAAEDADFPKLDRDPMGWQGTWPKLKYQSFWRAFHWCAVHDLRLPRPVPHLGMMPEQG